MPLSKSMEQKPDRRKYPVSASSYTLIEEVGQGASAIVHRAECIPMNETVAIKVLDLEKCNSNLDDIRREAQTMSLISHPNVLSAYCSFVVEHDLWVVMPYMAGGSCLHIMKSAFPDGFEEPVIATFLKECLKALEYLHSHGHIHRDVKAGNILVDAKGAIKLGDFGVSACMFDNGDRQRSRNTFVGTPCWMAPEVLEQVHGYDFKADIWSFGITALELAHGHAPFSKYPPMKVLLMTLQNAPPGLDYERDRRFSKSFKEMIAMCLVKDPAKRPTAEKLLRHSFFKHAKSCDYISRTILDGLPPLGERFRDLKIKDAERLAQKKMPFGEKEERSQSEYKRGVSSWNFDVEDLKAQAASLQDDDGCFVGKEDFEQPDAPCEKQSVILQSFSQDSLHEIHSPVRQCVDSVTDAIGHVTKVQTTDLVAPTQLSMADISKKCLSVHDDNKGEDVQVLNDNDNLKQQTGSLGRDDKGDLKKDDRLFRKLEERDWRLEKMQQEGRRASSGPLVSDYVLATYHSRDEEKDHDRQASRGIDDIGRTRSHHRERAYSGPLTSHAVPFDYRFNNGLPGPTRPTSGTKDGSDKALYVQKKGRFSVTSADVELVDERTSATGARRSASVQALPQLSHVSGVTSNSTNMISAAALLPYLQGILQHSVSQQDLISGLVNAIGQGDLNASHHISDFGSKPCYGSSGMCSSDALQVEISSDREHELLQQVADLQNRLDSLMDELQALKLRNASLERQLNAIYNKEEEERIRREDEAKEES